MKRSRAITGTALTAAAALAATLIMKWEGTRYEAYHDIAGVPTVCSGHTLAVEFGKIYTEEECKSLKMQDMQTATRAVERLIDNDLPRPTLAAVISAAFNIGEGNLAGSTMRRKLNQGDILGGCMELLEWVCITVAKGKGDRSAPCKSAKRNKQFSGGLLNRRKDELAVCLQGLL